MSSLPCPVRPRPNWSLMWRVAVTRGSQCPVSIFEAIRGAVNIPKKSRPRVLSRAIRVDVAAASSYRRESASHPSPVISRERRSTSFGSRRQLSGLARGLAAYIEGRESSREPSGLTLKAKDLSTPTNSAQKRLLPTAHAAPRLSGQSINSQEGQKGSGLNGTAACHQRTYENCLQ